MSSVRPDDTPKSKKILLYIQKHPGSSFSDISQILGINSSTLTYHLNRMEREEMISSKKIGNKRLYYPISIHSAGGSGITTVQRRVMQVIKDNPGITKGEICDITGSNSSSVVSALRALLRMEKITKVNIGGTVVYEYISKKTLKQRLFRELLARLIDGEIDERTFRILLDQLDRDLK